MAVILFSKAFYDSGLMLHTAAEQIIGDTNV